MLNSLKSHSQTDASCDYACLQCRYESKVLHPLQPCQFYRDFFFFICNCVSRGQRVKTEIHLLCLCFLIFEPPHSNTSLQFLKCCLYFWKPSIMSSLLFICLSSINPTFLLFSLSLALHSILKMQPPSHIPSPPPCPYLCSFSLFQLAF